MELTKASLDKRLAELKQQQAQMAANANAIAGAIQFCEMLLLDLATSDSPEPPASPV
jgi:hypothetical protein